MHGICLDLLMQILHMTQNFASQLRHLEMTSTWKTFFKELKELVLLERSSDPGIRKHAKKKRHN